MLHLLSITLVSTLTFATVGLPTRQAIVDQSLTARDSLGGNYHLKMTITSSPEGAPSNQVTTVETWSKGILIRTDEFKHKSTYDTEGVGLRRIICRNCERKGFGLSTRQGGVAGSLSQVQFFPLDHDAFNGSDGLRFDWMRLGQLHGYTATYLQEPADSTLRILSKVSGEVSEVSHDGRQCFVIQYTTKSGAVRRGHFRPDFGMNPVQYLDDVPSGKFRSETKISYAKFPGSDVWFPKTVIHTRTQAGKEILNQKIVVDQAELNTTVPDTIFTIAGLGLDIGQPVAFPEINNPNDHPTWGKDGLDWKSTVGKFTHEAYNQKMRQQAAIAPPPTSDVPPPSNRWLYYAGAGVLAVIAAGIAVVLARRRRAQPTS